MTHTVTDIPIIENIDQYKLKIGDAAEYPAKFAAFMAYLQTWADQVNASRLEMQPILEAAEADFIALNANTERAPTFNILPDHGTFLEAIHLPDGSSGFQGDVTKFRADSLYPYINTQNGSNLETPDIGDIFYSDSESFGGAQPACSADILNEWLPKMGGGSRTMPAWIAAEYTAGTGTTSTSHEGHYRQCNATNLSTWGDSQGNVSFSCYFRPIDVDCFIQLFGAGSTIQRYVDGVKLTQGAGEGASSNFYRLNAGQVYHLCTTWVPSTIQHISSSLFQTNCAPGSKFQIALPWATPGARFLAPHFRPVRSVGMIGQTIAPA